MSRIVAALRIAVAGLIAGGLMGNLLVEPAAAADTRVRATAGVNIRSGPSTSTKIIGSLRRGQTATATASKSGWTTIKVTGGKGYVASRYLQPVGVPTPAPPQPQPPQIRAGWVAVTTTGVNLRSGAGTTSSVLGVLRTGTRVTLTGVSVRGFAEVYAGRRGWVYLAYLARAGGVPAVIGTRVSTAPLILRTTPDASYREVGEIPTGTTVWVTGVIAKGAAQIVRNGSALWVTATYLIDIPYAAIEKGLTPNAVAVHRAARAKFAEITTYYGVRSGSGDHPTGRALDLMIPGYRSASGRALGGEVAAWARANARTLGIHYVIWDQKIWNIQRDREGWRRMADRGGDSANHKNHVHISVS
jgi:uncharacterized protein YraI